MSYRLDERKHDISRILDSLLYYVYNNLQVYKLSMIWKPIRSHAIAVWDTSRKTAEIHCNDAVLEWPDAAVTGLLAHEMAHIEIGTEGHHEEDADICAISKGMGVYLACERIITDKYTDHIVRRGNDRYLGYKTIREKLTQHELTELQQLLVYLNLRPKPFMHQKRVSNDFQLITKNNEIYLQVFGELILLEYRPAVEDVGIQFTSKGILVQIKNEVIHHFE